MGRLAQLVRASRLHREGPRFESVTAHQPSLASRASARQDGPLEARVALFSLVQTLSRTISDTTNRHTDWVRRCHGGTWRADGGSINGQCRAVVRRRGGAWIRRARRWHDHAGDIVTAGNCSDGSPAPARGGEQVCLALPMPVTDRLLSVANLNALRVAPCGTATDSAADDLQMTAFLNWSAARLIADDLSARLRLGWRRFGPLAF